MPANERTTQFARKFINYSRAALPPVPLTENLRDNDGAFAEPPWLGTALNGVSNKKLATAMCRHGDLLETDADAKDPEQRHLPWPSIVTVVEDAGLVATPDLVIVLRQQVGPYQAIAAQVPDCASLPVGTRALYMYTAALESQILNLD